MLWPAVDAELLGIIPKVLLGRLPLHLDITRLLMSPRIKALSIGSSSARSTSHSGAVVVPVIKIVQFLSPSVHFRSATILELTVPKLINISV